MKRPGLLTRLFAKPTPEQPSKPAPSAASGLEVVVAGATPAHSAQLLAAVQGTTAERVLGTYEAAQWSHNRSWQLGLVQDPDQDLTEAIRLEVLRRARFQEKNSPIFQRVLDLLEVNVVGTGLLPTPTTSAPEFNRQAKAFFDTWARRAALDNRETFSGLQALIVRAMAVDGEIFAHLATDDWGEPKVQLIESHRIAPATADTRWCPSGILCDDYGRATAYYLKGPDGTSTPIPAHHMVHFAEPGRTGQQRGLSLFHACLTTLQDLHELQTLEMLCAKSAALHAFVFKRRSGEAEPEGGADTYGELTARAAALAAAGYTPERAAQLRQAVGGQTVFLNEGEDFTQTENDRPSAAMREFWEYLVSLVARSVGLTRAALHDYEGWSGPALRGAIVADNRFYQVRTTALTDRLQVIYEHVLGWGVANGKITAPAPTDWRATRWHAPRRPTIDVGRDSAALLNELKAGVRTLRDVQGEMGLDYREVITQRLEEIAHIRAEATRLGLPPEAIAEMLGQAPSPVAPATAQPQPPATTP